MTLGSHEEGEGHFYLAAPGRGEKRFSGKASKGEGSEGPGKKKGGVSASRWRETCFERGEKGQLLFFFGAK